MFHMAVSMRLDLPKVLAGTLLGPLTLRTPKVLEPKVHSPDANGLAAHEMEGLFSTKGSIDCVRPPILLGSCKFT